MIAALLLAGLWQTELFSSNIVHHRPPSTCPIQELTFQSRGITLAASLYIPPGGTKPKHAIVLVAGSGPTGRKDVYMTYLSRMFATNGVAALVYDKPGVGDSPGTYVELPNLSERASDVVAAVEALSKRPETKSSTIGVWGVSQGGWVCPLAATMSSQIAYVITISGPAVSPSEQGLFSRTNDLRRAGLTEDQISIMISLNRKTSAYVQSGKGYDELKKAYDKYEGQPWFATAREKIVPPLVREKSLAHPDLAMFKDRLRMLYDPIPTLKKIHVPILACFGAVDPLVNAAESSRILEGLKRLARLRLTVKVYPNADHSLLVRSPKSQRPWPFAAGHFDEMLDWVGRQ